MKLKLQIEKRFICLILCICPILCVNINAICRYDLDMTEDGEEESREDTLLINTLKGKVQGATMTAATGKLVDAWLGIPYAQKPVGTSSL